jgi:hypothetical protein
VTDHTRLSSSCKIFPVPSTASGAAICRRKTRSTQLNLASLPTPGEHTLDAIPLRRATSLTFAPGASVSSTIRILSSCDQRRRRSTPPNTSMRIA